MQLISTLSREVLVINNRSTYQPELLADTVHHINTTEA